MWMSGLWNLVPSYALWSWYIELTNTLDSLTLAKFKGVALALPISTPLSLDSLFIPQIADNVHLSTRSLVCLWVHMCVCVCVCMHAYVCCHRGRGRELCGVCSSLCPIWGAAGKADRLSQRVTGLFAGHTAVMDRMGSGAMDRVAECEW